MCASCGAILPPAADPDRFALLGLPRSYAIDPVLLEERYRDLSRRLHPDRFARAQPRERMLSLSASTALNDALRTLRSPERRAEHLLALLGVRVTEREAADPAFLAEVLEWREDLEAARGAGNEGQIEVMQARMRVRRDAALADVARLFVDIEAGADRRADVRERLIAVRYMNRFLDEIAAGREER